MVKNEEKLLTVKEYAVENHVSRQSVNSKINRHKDELKGHVFIINGRKMLDGFAQDFLKPTKDNALLISKNAELEKSLEYEKILSKQNKSFASSQGNKVKVMTAELETKNKLIAEYEDRIKKLEQSISEKNAFIAEKDKRIAELTDKAAAFENFAEQLNALFGVLEETANTSVGKKIGNLLTGKK
jgi:uncharacterized protein (DUF3084 family)